MIVRATDVDQIWLEAKQWQFMQLSQVFQNF